MAEDLQRWSARDFKNIRDAQEIIEIPDAADDDPKKSKRLYSILHMAVSPLTGKLFICDNANHSVLVFSEEREYITSFGTEGDEDGELSCPWGIAVDLAGLVYVASRKNHRIEVFKEDGTFQRQIGGDELIGPSELFIHDQLLYVVSKSLEDSGSIVSVYTLQGEHVRSISRREFFYIDCIAVTPDGCLCIFARTNHVPHVLVLTSDGEYRDFSHLEPAVTVNDVTITKDGEVLVADLGKSVAVFFLEKKNDCDTNLTISHRIDITAEKVTQDNEGNILVLYRVKTEKGDDINPWRIATF